MPSFDFIGKGHSSRRWGVVPVDVDEVGLPGPAGPEGPAGPQGRLGRVGRHASALVRGLHLGTDGVILAARPHYADHIAPVAALVQVPEDVALVASHIDVQRARRLRARRVILMQHGVGQSYGGDPRTARVAAYPGGDCNEDVGLFLVPNDQAARRWRERYPRAAVRVIGCPKLDTLPAREPGPGPVVAVTFNWDPRFCPEARSALQWMAPGLAGLAARYRVIGTGHPRRRHLEGVYRRFGIEVVADFRDVCRRADVLVADNTSVLYEFAATGRPVVAMNAPWYRRNVHHGLRFWDAVPGPQADHPAELPDRVAEALAERPDRREVALGAAYRWRTRAAERAAAEIMEWIA